MKSRRIHITGASGAGVTSLGRALAGALSIPHHDTDDYFWQPTSPPYRDKREPADRLRLMNEMFVPRPAWVLSGSLSGWGDPLIPAFDRVVFVTTPTEIRLQRLRAREAMRFGADAVAAAGWRHQELEEFIEWASQYTMTIAPAEVWQNTRHGSPRCPARCCGWTGRNLCPNWLPKSAAQLTLER